jgi:hypothetical protein
MMQASVDRSAFYQQMVALFDRFDLLALPTAQVWPFPVEWRWPKEIAGRTMDTYHRWMEVVSIATFAGLPCVSVDRLHAAGLPWHAADRWPRRRWRCCARRDYERRRRVPVSPRSDGRIQPAATIARMKPRSHPACACCARPDTRAPGRCSRLATNSRPTRRPARRPGRGLRSG